MCSTEMLVNFVSLFSRCELPQKFYCCIVIQQSNVILESDWLARVKYITYSVSHELREAKTVFLTFCFISQE